MHERERRGSEGGVRVPSCGLVTVKGCGRGMRAWSCRFLVGGAGDGDDGEGDGLVKGCVDSRLKEEREEEEKKKREEGGCDEGERKGCEKRKDGDGGSDEKIGESDEDRMKIVMMMRRKVMII